MKKTTTLITDRIKTFQDACSLLKVPEKDVLAFTGNTPDELAVNALCKLIVIIRALNEGWQPDWNDNSQHKWYPWFDMEVDRNNPPGFRFVGAYCAYAGTYSAGGSRLCFKSGELAEYAGKQFTDIYQQLLK